MFNHRLLATAIGSAVVSRCLLPLGSLAIGEWYLTALHLAWCCVLVVGPVAVCRPLSVGERLIWAIGAGIVSAHLIPDLFRTGLDGDRLSLMIAAWPSLVLAGVLCVLSSANCRVHIPAAPLSPLRCGALSLSPLLCFAMYRITHAYFLHQGVPNEDRSLMINGIEIHHITWATVFVYPLVTAIRLYSKGYILRIVLMCLLGSIADEFVYMLSIRHIINADVHYSSAESTIGGFAVASCVGLRLLVTSFAGNTSDLERRSS